MTILIQLEPGLNFYEVRTDDKHVCKLLSENDSFLQFESIIENSKVERFYCQFATSKEAFVTMCDITNAEPQIGFEGIIVFDPYYLIKKND